MLSLAGGMTCAAQSVTICVFESKVEIRQADASKRSVSSRAKIAIASLASPADRSAPVALITAIRSENRRSAGTLPARMGTGDIGGGGRNLTANALANRSAGAAVSPPPPPSGGRRRRRRRRVARIGGHRHRSRSDGRRSDRLLIARPGELGPPLLEARFALHEDGQDRRRDEDRRVGAGRDADDQREREVLQRSRPEREEQ